MSTAGLFARNTGHIHDIVITRELHPPLAMPTPRLLISDHLSKTCALDFSTKLQGKNRQLKKHENINMDDFRLDWEKAKLSDIPSTHHPDSLVERYNIALRLVLKHNSFKQRKWYRKTEKKNWV